jgi:hypothetical protein
MNCWTTKLFKYFQSYYGKQINVCEEHFITGELKLIIVSLSRTLIMEPEEFINLLLIKSANIGMTCFKDNKIERIKLYDKCVFIAKKYKIDLPFEVEILIDERQQNKGLFNKLKSIFK